MGIGIGLGIAIGAGGAVGVAGAPGAAGDPGAVLPARGGSVGQGSVCATAWQVPSAASAAMRERR
jgi:hypothetical protein